MKHSIESVLFAILAGLGLSASAEITTTRIAPVKAWANSTASKTSVNYVINGSGLTASTGGHNSSNGGGSSVWKSETSPSYFVVDLGDVYSVADIKFWNYNGSKSTTIGLRQIDVFFATADDAYVSGAPDYTSGTWVEVLSDIELAKAPGTEGWTGNDPIVLATPRNARFVAIRVESTWGAEQGGLSELRFDVVDSTCSVALDSIDFTAPSTATLVGTMTATDGSGCEVFAAYGEKNPQKGLFAWDATVSCGSVESGVAFTNDLTGLAPDRTYYAALFVSNQTVATSWSAATNFITGVVSVRMPSAFCEADSTVKHIVFTRSASCAAEALVVNYALAGDAAADYESALTGTALFEAGKTEAAVTLTPVKDEESADDKTLTVTVLPGLYATDATSGGSVTILDTANVAATNPSWTGGASTRDWDTAGNWSTGALPNYLDAVTIDAASSSDDPVRMTAYDHTVKTLTIGGAADSSGALRLDGGENARFTATAGMTVGGNGAGTLTVDSGLMLAGPGKNIILGNHGTADVTVNAGGSFQAVVSGSSGYILLGNASDGLCRFTVNGGNVFGGYGIYIGAAGRAEVKVNGGSFSGNGKTGIHIGKDAGSSGELVLTEDATVSHNNGYCHIGNAGTGVVRIVDGLLKTRGINVGEDATGVGRVTVEANGVLNSYENYSTTIGGAGWGEILLRGGSIVPGNTSNSIMIRQKAAAYGLLHGWGSINGGKNGIYTNNGLVIADGCDAEGVSAERTLSFARGSGSNAFANTIENDGTNGWYAVNKGLLSATANMTLAVGDSGVYTWGEAESDDTIDLVNSVRVTFTNITTKVTAFTGNLYAADRSDVPALPGGRTAAGVWKFGITGAYESATVEFRYDHVKAPKGVAMYQLGDDGATWTRLDTTLLGGCRARVSVPDATRMFAAAAVNPGLTLFVR